MYFKSVITGLFAAAILSATPAQAQAQQQVVTQFNDSTISRLLLDVQAGFNIEGGANGEKVYRAQADGGLAFTLSPRACSPENGCVGLLMVTVFTRSDSRNLGELDALINRYNDLNPNAKVYRMDDGTVVLQGYINAAYGISYTNAQAQLLVFGSEIVKVRDTLTAFGEGR